MAYRITDICVACGTCIDECPVGAISEGDIYKIDENACVSCGTCAGACPTGAALALAPPVPSRRVNRSQIQAKKPTQSVGFFL